MGEHVIIAGGGGTGVALAHDLAGRGLAVTLFERGELFSGSTGRHHGLLHSGARYAVHDPVAARECAEENRILRQIAPWAIEQNDGLFVALDEADMGYLEAFLDGCAAAGIPTRTMTGDEARGLEPALSGEALLAVRVPDASFDTFRLPLSFAATALSRGARIRRFHEVTGVVATAGRVEGVRVRSLLDGGVEREVRSDVVVNACGAWAGDVALGLPVRPAPGVMVALEGRLTDMVINHLHPAAEGDIVLPQRRLTVVGTSLWLDEHPDRVRMPPEHAARMIELGARLVPAVAEARVKASWHASRPLLGAAGPVPDPQQISRTFQCFDHGDHEGPRGLFSLIGGKATTLRAMAEAAADRICAFLGCPELECRTRSEVLLGHRAFFALAARGGA